jgi:hypothetical protein
MEKLLQNKYVLYLVLFIAITNILGYLAIEDFKSLMVFIAICALASHFSKNMIIILGSAVLGTSIVYANSRIREGLENGGGESGINESGESGARASKKEGYPASKKKNKRKKNGDEKEDVSIEDFEVKTPRVDYGATMEIAYDNLNKMLGEGGMKNLTKDTQGLMDQQKQLMQQLKDFAPLMEQAGNMLDKLGGMDNLKGLMGKMGGISLPNGKKK